ncbi:GIY-YIG nuclease family protein [Patescibacteria group bacterium]|nr:GIY-YIG nuclease family protein [Patescibacteria group bacterium]
MVKQGYVYIIGNNRPTLYIGVTSNLQKRIWEHKQSTIKGFSSKYKLTKLLYFEIHSDIKQAIKREKQLKRWHREWKLNLIKSQNPELNDLWSQ